MPKKELLFLTTIILMGLFDWLTTVTGVLFFGAIEVNPLFSEITKTNMILFSAIKLSAITLAGFAFYKAATITKPTTTDWHFTKRFLDIGYSLTFLTLTSVVASNMITLLSV